MVFDLVDPAQIADIALADAATAVLESADLRLRDEQPVRHLFCRHALGLSKPAQLLAQSASPDGGVDVGRHAKCTSGSVLLFSAQQTATNGPRRAGKWLDKVVTVEFWDRNRENAPAHARGVAGRPSS